ncbi:putative toxin-antitoxin system toxin component, PIN family [Variovorax sp. PBS-H4]|uniref:putative toxin-antitoxin system toxin component, PIN family n=1 Tax=Variovorax sp. PBS-H4 TaxID=434008 RepID=UPI0013173684|nr:putative toxin-antitoxin system toxin component, PIN family [Variovorax sp. PBS-H4]VTU40866.1 putative toxin-antitoxin system toxin component, PIN family [Variovorax sp. PBS-H4]
MRIVIDTNIALDLLVFDDPSCAALLAALQAGELQWIATPAMRDELARVLSYRLVAERLARKGRDAEHVLAAFDRHVQPMQEVPPRALCLCSDPDDQIFVDLAVAQRARLLSKDRALLEMRKQLAALGVEVATQ